MNIFYFVNCPECNAKGAFIGLRQIYCQNKDCRHYTDWYRRKVEDEDKSVMKQVEKLVAMRNDDDDDLKIDWGTSP